MTSARKVIVTRGLTKELPLGKVVVHALRGVDLDIYAGEMVGIVGRRVRENVAWRLKPLSVAILCMLIVAASTASTPASTAPMMVAAEAPDVSWVWRRMGRPISWRRA